MIRAVTAELVYPSNSEPIKNGIVEFSEEGEILHIGREASGRAEYIEELKGIICPGFVNTHCHLELSHLINRVQQKTGLHAFIQNLQKVRETDPDAITEAVIAADKEMWKNGIVAVGDISNSNVTFLYKLESKLYYHTFIELFGFDKNKAEQIFIRGKQLANELKTHKLSGNVTPHSPYSVSSELMQKITADSSFSPLSIHNQETDEENKMFMHKKGKMLEMLESFRNDISEWKHTNTSSIKACLSKLTKAGKLLLVHNTFTSKADIEWAGEKHKKLYWCFCPKANLYIEGCLPKISDFHQMGVKCTLGTDSLASNDTLSILEEMKVIQENFPEIPLTELIQWASYNGAEFLGIETMLGSIEKGKKPGILNIKLDKEGSLQGSKLKRLI